MPFVVTWTCCRGYGVCPMAYMLLGLHFWVWRQNWLRMLQMMKRTEGRVDIWSNLGICNRNILIIGKLLEVVAWDETWYANLISFADANCCIFKSESHFYNCSYFETANENASWKIWLVLTREDYFNLIVIPVSPLHAISKQSYYELRNNWKK